MKKLTLILTLFLSAGLIYSANAQEQTEAQSEKAARKEAKKLEKAAKKNEQERLLNEQFEKFKRNTQDSTFVIEAHTLYDRKNLSYPVSPNTNFVMVEGDLFTMQIASNAGMGLNGLGGITMEGRITKYVDDTKKNGPIKLKITVSTTTMGSTNVILSVNRSGNTRANVSGSFGERISFGGNFKPLEESIVFKGSTTY